MHGQPNIKMSKLCYILIQGLTKASIPIQVSSQKSCLICEYKYSVRMSLLRVQFTFLVSGNSTGIIYYYQNRL